MINLSPEASKLNILSAGNNKAIQDVIKNATPEQLNTLKESGDLKAFLSNIFQEKSASTKTDTVLLDLLKNSAEFKKLGSFSESLGELLKDIKADPKLAGKTPALENFAKQIEMLDSAKLKSQIVSSGVFMESKIASSIDKIPNLIKTLEKILQNIPKDTNNIPQNMSQANQKTMPQNTQALKTEPQTILQQQMQNTKATQIKNLPHILSHTPQTQKTAITNQANAILNSPLLQSAPKNFSSAVALSEQIKSLNQMLQNALPKDNIITQQTVLNILDKLQTNTNPPEIRANLTALLNTINQNPSALTADITESIEQALKEPESNIKNQATNISNNIRATIANIQNSEITNLASKLLEFNDPNDLNIERSLEKSMVDDMKSNLLKLKEELVNSPHPNAARLMEISDKLLTQIDYHQLVSHLSNTSSIYFPFAWDQLQDGQLAFKKGEDNKFYCEINLTLKDYGELNLLMGIYDKTQLDMQIHTQSKELKDLVFENLPLLRSALIKAELTPRIIRVHDRSETKNIVTQSYENYQKPNGAFEIKI